MGKRAGGGRGWHLSPWGQGSHWNGQPHGAEICSKCLSQDEKLGLSLSTTRCPGKPQHLELCKASKMCLLLAVSPTGFLSLLRSQGFADA